MNYGTSILVSAVMERFIKHTAEQPNKAQNKMYCVTQYIGLAQTSVPIFHTILPKNPTELFDQPNRCMFS